VATTPIEEHTQVKHVMSALTPQWRKERHTEGHEGGHSRIMTA
jgi:hypothetical protein